ncbi:MAG: PBS lyase [Spirochaetaceae bacterium]
MISTIKRAGVIAGIVFFLGVTFLAANEVAAVWTRLYDRATSLEQKNRIMMNIVEQDSKDMIPVLTRALEEEVDTLANPMSTTERQRQIELLKMIVKELGSLKAREASHLVWDVVETAEDTILKGEAVFALGKMGARRYGEELALMLRNLNNAGDEVSRQRENETLAYSLVKAFERLKHEAGLEHVFFASQGWYSRRSGVKEAAEKALQVMSDDPSNMLIEVVDTHENYRMKLAALEAGFRSNAPDERKAEIAAAALEKGIRISHENLVEKRELKNLRLTALKQLEELPKPEEGNLVSNMGRMLLDYQRRRGYDEDEVLALLQTMGTYESDEMAEIVSDFLGYLNERREFGPVGSLRIPTQTIQTLGNIGSVKGLEELMRVSVSEYWEGSVRREAERARDQIED